MAGLLATLGTICREHRQAAGRTLTDIEQRTGIAASTISRFENGGRVPRQLDVLIDGYAIECGTTALELWEEALRRWS